VAGWTGNGVVGMISRPAGSEEQVERHLSLVPAINECKKPITHIFGVSSDVGGCASMREPLLDFNRTHMGTIALRHPSTSPDYTCKFLCWSFGGVHMPGCSHLMLTTSNQQHPYLRHQQGSLDSKNKQRSLCKTLCDW
jgi:hypothetical protein